MSYWLLFISAFGAATLLPLQSEAVLITLLIQGFSNPLYLILIATIGNVLGSCVNWWLGLKIEHFKDKKWFPVSEKNMSKAEKIYQKYVVRHIFCCIFVVILMASELLRIIF